MKKIEISELCYADNMVIIAEDGATLNENLKIYKEALKEININISMEKTKTMVMERKELKHKVDINNKKLQQV